MSAVLRFAPSPNGELHLGHALSAIVGHDMARAMAGRFLVRIEDIDIARCRPELADAALADLAWLGLTWDGPVLRQSEHFDVYRAAARRLADMGLLYPCFATRAEIVAVCGTQPAALDPDGAPLYPGIYKDLDAGEAKRRVAAGEPHASRLDMRRALAMARDQLRGGALTFLETGEPAAGVGAAHVGGCSNRTIQARPERWGDAVIVRKDVPASYHLAVVVDDARQGISHVTRGMDLYAATDLHRLLQVLLDLPEPIYHHHRLITDASGRKLAKSARDTSVRSLRDSGWSALDVRAAALNGQPGTSRR